MANSVAQADDAPVAPVMVDERAAPGGRTAKAHPPRLRGLEIDELTVDDIAGVFHLGERVFTAERWPTLFRTWDEYEVLSAYQSDLETSLVATIEGELAGFALGTLIEKDRNAWVYGYVKWVAVDPKFAGWGVGGALVRALRAAFIEMGARMLLVDTEADNLPARAFFKKLGFAQETEHVYLSLNLTKEPDYQRHRRRQPVRARAAGKSGAGARPGAVPPVDEAAGAAVAEGAEARGRKKRTTR
jgi:ribosomal protein S18 acetylase RimI-like enzyme